MFQDLEEQEKRIREMLSNHERKNREEDVDEDDWWKK